MPETILDAENTALDKGDKNKQKFPLPVLNLFPS